MPDLLLASSGDETPIVGEVKITDGAHADKDPHGAFIQALAAVAHLATDSRYQRLRATLPDAHYREPGNQLPQLDLYLVLVRFDKRDDRHGRLD